MERLGAVQARIASVRQLQEVVAAMRSLAAMRMAQAADTLAGARRYGAIIGAALAQALCLAAGPPPFPPPFPPPGGHDDGPRALLVFAPEHGFVGGYAETLAEAARAAAPQRLLVIGAKGAQALAEGGRTADWAMPMASHAGGLDEVARRAADRIVEGLAGGWFVRLDLLFGRILEGGRRGVVRQALLPPDFSGLGGAAGPHPLHHLPAEELLRRMIEEYMLSELVLAATEAMAAENAARLEAMTAAGDNIERKLGELQGLERILRQEQITEELLDVVNGAELLMGGLT